MVNADWEAAKRSARLNDEWGHQVVPGLDPARAVALRLKPTTLRKSYANADELPPHLAHPAVAARYVRRTAELLLRSSNEYKTIERATRETHAHFDPLLRDSRLTEESYRSAASVLLKMESRIPLVLVWLRSCPGLLRSKTREVELLRAGGDESALHSPEYQRVLAEKQRIDIIYDAVISLKELESERPIRPADVRIKYEAATELADAALERIHREEKALSDKLASIGDGGESVLGFVRSLEDSLSSAELRLAHCELCAVPPLLFAFEHLELLDLSDNEICELPPEVRQLKRAKKLYLNRNKLTNLPSGLCELESNLVLLSCADNPLEPSVHQLYLAGLPILMEHLKLRARAEMHAERKLRHGVHALGQGVVAVQRLNAMAAYSPHAHSVKGGAHTNEADPFACFPKRVKNRPVRPFSLGVPGALSSYPHVESLAESLRLGTAGRAAKLEESRGSSALGLTRTWGFDSRARTAEGGARAMLGGTLPSVSTADGAHWRPQSAPRLLPKLASSGL